MIIRRVCPGSAKVGLTTAALLAAATLVGGLCAPLVPIAGAGDWPTYRHDVARSGITAEKLAWPLKPSWVFRARVAPQPAWGDPKPVPVEEILELRRVHFDDVFQVVAADGTVCFGSSGDNKPIAWTPLPAKSAGRGSRADRSGWRLRWLTAACTWPPMTGGRTAGRRLTAPTSGNSKWRRRTAGSWGTAS